MSLSVFGGRIYFVEPNCSSAVKSMDSGGGNLRALFSSLASKPYRIAVDPGGNYVFWLDTTRSVKRGPITGGTPTTLGLNLFGSPNGGIAVDASGERT